MDKRDRVWNTPVLEFLRPPLEHIFLGKEHELAFSMRQQKKVDVRTDLEHFTYGVLPAGCPRSACRDVGHNLPVGTDGIEVEHATRTKGNTFAGEPLSVLASHPLPTYPIFNRNLDTGVSHSNPPAACQRRTIPLTIGLKTPSRGSKNDDDPLHTEQWSCQTLSTGAESCRRRSRAIVAFSCRSPDEMSSPDGHSDSSISSTTSTITVTRPRISFGVT